ncbi:MAG: hypothetical protein ACOYL6_15295 [Bacteriovoracaceae bacterium]
MNIFVQVYQCFKNEYKLDITKHLKIEMIKEFFFMLKHYGLYPFSTWTMEIHCDNCSYEGPCSIDKLNYGFFLISTLFVIWVAITYGFKTWSVYSIPRTLVSTYTLYFCYLSYFLKPQPYHCPKCDGTYGTPLSFYKHVNQKD